uniref:Disrupted in renal carcinoma protein 2 homolog n=1 Tax=Phallusia mammillata TaxID=59560 RepID=A0A6F9DSY3_9ASCI|nr:disrupted in renal carcinoma protein 2 homolog [Phallusia mammillata]
MNTCDANSEEERLTSSSCEDESSSLLPSEKSGKCKIYWYRWYICFVFAFLGLAQGAVWNTWSPIDDSAEVALGFTPEEITMLTNWGPITFIISMPFYMWLLDNKGLRPTVVSGAFLVALGTALRCLPLDVHILKYFIHAGQILNGISGCPVMAVPALMSNVWFPPEQRITATGITTLFNYFGTGAAFIIGPLFVQQPSNNTRNISCSTHVTNFVSNNGSCQEVYALRSQIKHVMYMEFGVSAAIFISMFIFFPNKPPSPPSISASLDRLNLKEGLIALKSNARYWVVAVTSAMVLGTWGGWTGVMPLLFSPLGISQNTSDLMGFVTTLAGCAIGMVIGWLTDRLKGRMKLVLVILFTVCLLAFAYFVILANKWLKFPPFVAHEAEVWVVLVVLGIAMNAAVPLTMEMSADAAYPISEGTSASFVVWLMNVLSFVFLLGLNVSSNPLFANYILLACLVLAVPILAFGIKEVNQRLQLDKQVKDDESEISSTSYGSVDCNVNTKRMIAGATSEEVIA